MKSSPNAATRVLMEKEYLRHGNNPAYYLKLPGPWTTFFSFLNIKRIRPQYFALQRGHSLFCLIVLLHLNDSLSLA